MSSIVSPALRRTARSAAKTARRSGGASSVEAPHTLLQPDPRTPCFRVTPPYPPRAPTCTAAACPAHSRRKRVGRPRPSGAPAQRTRARAFEPTPDDSKRPQRPSLARTSNRGCSCGWQGGRLRASCSGSGRSSAARRKTRRSLRGSPRGVGWVGGEAGLGGGARGRGGAREGGREGGREVTSIQSVLKMMSTITTMSNFGFWLSAMQNFRGCLLLSRQNSACTERTAPLSAMACERAASHAHAAVGGGAPFWHISREGSLLAPCQPRP